MCNPGISNVKTDKELAESLRRHYDAAMLCREELKRRGWRVVHQEFFPSTWSIKKEVSI